MNTHHARLADYHAALDRRELALLACITFTASLGILALLRAILDAVMG